MSVILYSSQGYRWRPVDSFLDNFVGARMLRILHEWEGTPYVNGQQMKQVGANCAMFLCGVLDELLGEKRTPLAAVSDDAQFHDAARSMHAVAAMRRAYPQSHRVRGMDLELGDVIVVGQKLGGPGHVMLVGPEPNTLWHCNRGIGVRRTGLGFEASAQVVKAVYRFDNRVRWLP